MRLTDTGGRLAAAEIRPAHPLSPPPVGARVVIRGRIRFDEEHSWYAIDPVEEWLHEHRWGRNENDAGGGEAPLPAFVHPFRPD